MVVLAASILSKSGEVLLSRQFCEITKGRIEGYLSFFPKNVTLNSGGQTLDTENVRFVYQSINQAINQVNQWEPSYNQSNNPSNAAMTQTNNQGIWVLLITNKQSNIVEDLETLSSIVKLLPEYCPINAHHQPIEQTIRQNVFELIFALDEVINPGGQSANQSISAIKTYTAMDSHEEKLQAIIQQSKIKEAKIEAQRKAEEIEQQRRINAALNQAMQTSQQSSMNRSYDEPEYRSQTTAPPAEREKPAVSSSSSSSNAPVKKGMSLGAKKTGDTFFDQLSKEEKLAPVVRPAVAEQSSNNSATSSQPSSQYGVTVVAKERMSVEIDRDGSAQSVIINGDLKCAVFDPQDSKIAIQIGQSTSQSMEQLGYKLQLHPKMDKKQWASNKVITVGDAAKGLPIGSDNALVILKWRKKGSDSDVPFTLTYWQNQESKQMAVNVEFALQDDLPIDLNNVQIRIPVEGTPDVSQIAGEYRYDPRAKILTWLIPVINAENSQGTLDFTCSNSDYPINVDFTSESLLSGLVVEKIQDVNDAEREVNAQIVHKLEVEKYVIGATEE